MNIMPNWFWYLIYFYIIITPHILFIILVTRITYDTFIGEPAIRKKEKAEARQKELKALADFNRLYDSGGHGCPVLRAAKS